MNAAASRHDAQQVMYGAAAVTTWLFWDTVIHFDVEVDAIWRRPRAWVKLVYGFIRYTPILHTGALVIKLGNDHVYSNATCTGWIYYELIYMEVLTFLVDFVLAMRLYILWNENKWVLWTIAAAFLAEVVVMIVCLCLVLPVMRFTPDCLVAHTAGIFVSYWAASLAFETLLFVLTLVKFYQSVTRTFKERSILDTFVRDGTWAFTLIFVAMLLNLLLYKLSKTPLAGMGYGWALASLSFAGAHIMLNLRRFGTHKRSAETALPTVDRIGQKRPLASSTADETTCSRFTTVVHGVTTDLDDETKDLAGT